MVELTTSTAYLPQNPTPHINFVRGVIPCWIRPHGSRIRLIHDGYCDVILVLVVGWVFVSIVGTAYTAPSKKLPEIFNTAVCHPVNFPSVYVCLCVWMNKDGAKKCKENVKRRTWDTASRKSVGVVYGMSMQYMCIVGDGNEELN